MPQTYRNSTKSDAWMLLLCLWNWLHRYRRRVEIWAVLCMGSCVCAICTALNTSGDLNPMKSIHSDFVCKINWKLNSFDSIQRYLLNTTTTNSLSVMAGSQEVCFAFHLGCNDKESSILWPIPTKAKLNFSNSWHWLDSINHHHLAKSYLLHLLRFQLLQIQGICHIISR